MPDTTNDVLLPSSEVATAEAAGLVAALLAWTALFAAGMFIGSAPARQKLAAGPTEALEFLRLWSIVLATYTPSNSAFLAALAGVLGMGLRRLRSARAHSILPTQFPYLTAVIRGFFVFLLVIFTVLIFDDRPLTQPTQHAYTKLAGGISLLSFLVTYSPSVVGKIWDRTIGRLERRFTEE